MTNSTTSVPATCPHCCAPLQYPYQAHSCMGQKDDDLPAGEIRLLRLEIEQLRKENAKLHLLLDVAMVLARRMLGHMPENKPAPEQE